MINLNRTLTADGLALFTGQQPGFSVDITHIAFGGQKYDPSGYEQALKQEFVRYPIDGAALISPSSIQVGVLMTNIDPAGKSANDKWIGEIGFYAGTTLFAVLSHAAAYLFYKSPDINIPVTYVLDFSVLPPGSVTVNNDALSADITLAASYAQTAAKTALDVQKYITSSYYGASAIAPASRPDGSPRQKGDRYFDTTANAEMTWTGALWYIPNVDTAGLADNGAYQVGIARNATGAIKMSVGAALDTLVYTLENFGAKGNGADDTNAIQKAIDSGEVLRITPRTFIFENLSRLARNNLTIIGSGSGLSRLKYTGSAPDALKIDAFESGLANAQYLQNVVLRGFSVEGHSGVKRLVNLQGLSRSELSDINVLNAYHGTDSDAGIGFLFSGIQLSMMTRLMCSQNRQPMISVPYEGFRFQAGTRAGVNVGNCSNNQMIGCFAEGDGTANGLEVGWRIYGADQLVVIGGSPESCHSYGILIGPNSRMNLFQGVGCENLNSTADFVDSGLSNKFINCYGSQKVILQGRQGLIDGGYYERIQVDAGAKKNKVRNCIVNNWATNAGGFFNNDQSTVWTDIYDADLGSFIYPLGVRAGISVGASPSPFQWQNTTGQYVEVIIQAGTVTQVRIIRGSDSWVNPPAVPGKHLLAPTDTIEVSFSVVPQMSYVPLNGFQS